MNGKNIIIIPQPKKAEYKDYDKRISCAGVSSVGGAYIGCFAAFASLAEKIYDVNLAFGGDGIRLDFDPNLCGEEYKITVTEEEDAKFLKSILEEVLIYPKIILRKKGYVIYLKKSEQIGDFLKFVGAINCLFSFEDNRIKRDYSNYVNRIINCDIANEEKAMKSAQKQIKHIQYIQKHYGYAKLSQRLLDAIILRSKYPEYSLSALSEESLEVTGRIISKSGLSHCFKDLEKLYLEVKAKK